MTPLYRVTTVCQALAQYLNDRGDMGQEEGRVRGGFGYRWVRDWQLTGESPEHHSPPANTQRRMLCALMTQSSSCGRRGRLSSKALKDETLFLGAHSG